MITENKLKHMEFIQATICRLNTNSFQLKCGMITILAALLTFFASSTNRFYVIIAIVTTVLFWGLDAYYLQQERKFRGIYNDVANLSSKDERILVKEFEMPTQKYTGRKYSYFGALCSKTILPLYLVAILLLLSIVFFY